MCKDCNNTCMGMSGLGNGRPVLEKVETYTAPIFNAPTMPTYQTTTQNRVYVPPVTASQNVWNSIGGTVNSVLGFINANKQNNLLAQQQYNDPSSYAFAQQPQYANNVVSAAPLKTGLSKFISENQLLSAGIATALVAGTIYVVKK